MENNLESNIKKNNNNHNNKQKEKINNLGSFSSFILKDKLGIIEFNKLLEEKYSNNAFYIFSNKNKFRLFCIKIIENKYFKILCYLIILLNAFMSFFYNYKKRFCHRFNSEILYNKCKKEYKNEIKIDEGLDYIFLLFNIFYTIEMLIKIFAQGLILHKFAYLTNFWNVIDCGITFYEWIKFNNNKLGNLNIFRCIQLIRVLKNFKLFQGMNKLIDSIILSLPTLGNIFLFISFMLLIFGILGMQLFSGVFYNRCRHYPILIQNQNTKNGLPYYQSKPINEHLCSPNNYSGTYQCPKNSYCVNFYEIVNYFNLSELNVTMESFDKNDENLNENEYLFYGKFNFDNIVNCLVNCFTYITLQNWAFHMSVLLESCSSAPTFIYFNVIIIFGGFFIIKLVLAAQNDALNKIVNDYKNNNNTTNNEKSEFDENKSNFIHNFMELEKRSTKNYLTKSSKNFSCKNSNNNNINSDFNFFSNNENIDHSINKNDQNKLKLSFIKEKKKLMKTVINKKIPLNEIKKLTDNTVISFLKIKNFKEKTKTNKNKKFLSFKDNEIPYIKVDGENSSSINNSNNNLNLISNIQFSSNNNSPKNNNNKRRKSKFVNSKLSFEKNQNEKIFHFNNNEILIVLNKKYFHKIKNINSFLLKNHFKHYDNFFYNYFSIYNNNIKIVNNFNNNNFEEKNKTGLFEENTNKEIENFFKVKKSVLQKFKKIAINRIKYFVLDEYNYTIQYKIFNAIIYLLVAINIILLCLLKYPMNDKLSKIIEKSNIVCTIIFGIEILFKLIVLGMKKWFENKFNFTEMVIFLLSLFELIYCHVNKDKDDNANGSLSALRAIRFIRLFKFAKKGGFFQKFIVFIIVSLKDLVFYCILLIIFIIIFAIAGREFFANEIYIEYSIDDYNYIFDEKISPRENFDTLIDSFVTTFIFFIGDRWPFIMSKYMKIFHTSSVVFFLAIIFIGNIALLNIFLSIMLNNYNQNYDFNFFIKNNKKKKKLIKNNISDDDDFSDDDDDVQKLKKKNKIKFYFYKIKEFFYKFLNICIKENNTNLNKLSKRRKAIIKNDLKSSENFVKKVEKYKNHLKIERKSFNYFSSTNKIRLFCAKIVQDYKWFEIVSVINIIISLIILALDGPYIDDLNKKKLLFSFDVITTIFSFIEIILKSISFGFLFNGENSYLRYEFNSLDFISFVISVIYLSLSYDSYLKINNASENISNSMKVLRFIKLLRLFRIIKIFELSKSLQAVIKSFYNSCIEVIKIVLIASLFILIFDIIGVNYFRGRFSRCDFLNVPQEFMSKVRDKWSCLDYGGDWVTPYPNLDNIGTGFILFFEMMTTDNWSKYMFYSMDATTFNTQPVVNNSKRWCLFFIAYMLFSFFFILNLSIVILSDNFKKEKEKIENNHFKQPIQNEFLKIFKQLFKVNVPKNKIKSDKCAKSLITILDSIYFEVVVIVCICANLFVLAMNLPNRNEMTSHFFSNMNLLFNYVFIVEAVLKIYAYRCDYFTNGWNLLDFVVVCEALITLLLKNYVSFLNDELETALFKTLRVGRVLKLLKNTEKLRKIMILFFNCMPVVMNVLFLYFILIYVYSIIGMSIFYDLKYQTIISEKWNFKNFVNSFLILIRISSGEGWNIILHEASYERDGKFDCKYESEMTNDEIYNENIGCGTIYSFPFFISFVIFSTLMFLNFFSAVISTAMNDTYVTNLEELKIGEINKFKNKWIKYDKKCTGFMKINKLHKFFYSIGHPLGTNSLRISEFIRICSLLNIYTYRNEGNDYVYFYDVLIELTKYYFIHLIVEDEYNTEKYQNINNNMEDFLEEKAEAFIDYMFYISEMQKDFVYKRLNPYNRNNKLNEEYKMIEYNRNTGLIKSRYMGVHINWAIKRLSSFTKLYKSMKKKTVAMIERVQYYNDMDLYINLYMKKIYNSNIQIYKEEDEDYNSYNSSDSSNNKNNRNYKNNHKNNKKYNNNNSNNISLTNNKLSSSEISYDSSFKEN